MRTICFCNGTIAWGGGEKWHLEAARWFATHGWRVFLLCHPQGELCRRATADPAITVKPLAVGRLSFLNPFLMSSLARFFRQERVEAVILNLPSDLKAAGQAAKKAGVRHIFYRRGSALPVKNSCLNRRLYGKVITRLIVNSQATADMVLKNNPDLIEAERITLLSNGIDIPAFDAALASAAPLPFRGEGEGRVFTLGNAGRLNKQKGQHYLLHLVKQLKDRGVPVRLVIAGEGELRGELEALAARLGIVNQVFFAGFMSDLAPFWKGIDCFVLSSLWEGFGFVLAEAMLARLPVLAFGVSNIPEIVHDNVTGRLFDLPTDAPVPDLSPMAGAVQTLAASPELCATLGEAGRAKAVLEYSQEAAMRVLEGLLS